MFLRHCGWKTGLIPGGRQEKLKKEASGRFNKVKELTWEACLVAARGIDPETASAVVILNIYIELLTGSATYTASDGGLNNTPQINLGTVQHGNGKWRVHSKDREREEVPPTVWVQPV